jgi:hypothetical protein
MTTRVSCPYCNTSFVPPTVPLSRRIDCPRCGEAFAVKPGEDEPADDSPAAAQPGPSAPPATPSPVVRTRTWSALWPIVIAAGMGLVGLGIGVGAYYLRGHRAGSNPDADAGPNATPTPPAELAGLAYLPPDCNLVAAVQPGPLLAYTSRTNQDPREILQRAEVPAGVLAFLERAGVPLAQIDHVVVGAPVADAVLELRVTLVFVLRRPLADEERFLDALEAKKDKHGRPRHDVVLDVGWKVPLAVVRVSPTVWVFGMQDADLGPAEHGGGSQIAPGFREMIAQRLAPETAAWIAADTGNWANKPLVKLVAERASGQKWLPLLAKGRAAVGGLSFGKEPRARLFVRCADEPTGAKLREYFQTKATPGAQAGGAGEWALYDAPLDPRAALETLKEFINDAAK